MPFCTTELFAKFAQSLSHSPLRGGVPEEAVFCLALVYQSFYKIKDRDPPTEGGLTGHRVLLLSVSILAEAQRGSVTCQRSSCSDQIDFVSRPLSLVLRRMATLLHGCSCPWPEDKGTRSWVSL